MKHLAYIMLALFFMSFFMKGYANGNHALNASYSQTKRGLNYVQASGKAALRTYKPLGNWPVSLSISGIPQFAVIEKAFVYFTAGYITNPVSNPVLYFTNPASINRTFNATNIGVDVPKCWYEDGNVTYRADVTSYITGNGTYTMYSNTDDSLTDGFTLFIIYRDDTATYTGSIFINDGLRIDSFPQSTKVAINVPDTALMVKAFALTSDLQNDTFQALMTLKDSFFTADHYFTEIFWNFEESSFKLGKNRTSVSISIYPPYIDCFAMAMAGVYLQMADTPVTIAEPFLDTLYCVGDTFDLKYSVITKFRSNNVFKVFLSEGNGSFTNSTLIGSKNSDTAGYVTCVIPANAPADSNYILRITASSPVDTIGNNDKKIRISHYPLHPVVMSSSPACEGTTLSLYDFSIDLAAQYTWTGPNNFRMTLQNPQVLNIPLAGNGTYVLFKENYSCGFRDSLPVVVKPRPAKPSLAVTGPACEGDSVKVTAFSTSSGISYNVQTPSRYLPGLALVDTLLKTITPQDSGWYKAVAVLDGCLSLIDSALGIVYRMPHLQPVSNSPVCQGSNIEFRAGDTTLGATYIWQGPGGFGSPLKDPVIGNADFPNGGTYKVVAYVHQCADTDSTTVAIKPMPAKPKLTNNSPVCETDTLHLFIDDSTSGLSYHWTGPNGFTSDEQNPVIGGISMSDSGKYMAGINLNGCNNNQVIDVVVKPMPIKPVPISNSPLKLGERLQFNIVAVTPGADYKWAGPDNFISTQTGPYINPFTEANVGAYTVAANLDGCISSGSTDVEIYKDNDSLYFRFYPNPNNGNFTLEGLFAVDQEIHVAVTNVIGQSIYRNIFATDNKRLNVSVHIPFVADGFYYLKANVNGRDKAIPFVIGR